jgi:hypothetical protein
MKHEKKNIIKNDPTIDNIVQKLKVLFSKSKFNKILYNTIHTASFKTPSPKRIENNFGI